MTTPTPRHTKTAAMENDREETWNRHSLPSPSLAPATIAAPQAPGCWGEGPPEVSVTQGTPQALASLSGVPTATTGWSLQAGFVSEDTGEAGEGGLPVRSISCPGSLSRQTQTSPPTRPPGVPSPDQGRAGASCLRGILHEISHIHPCGRCHHYPHFCRKKNQGPRMESTCGPQQVVQGRTWPCLPGSSACPACSVDAQGPQPQWPSDSILSMSKE